MFNLFKVSSRSMRTTSTSWNTAPQTTGAPEKLSIPVPEGVDKPVNPKLDNIVSQIAGLNLLEVSELSSLLKRKLNLPDTAMMPMGGFAAPAAPAAGKPKLYISNIIKNYLNY
jgi:large subunit ribosomal protein L7/L12